MDPADRLLDGNLWELTPGEDYPLEREYELRTRLYYLARKRKIHVQIKRGPGVMYVRAYEGVPGDLTPPADEPPAPAPAPTQP